MQWMLILGLIFALITAVFAVINVNPVQVNLYFNVVQVPLILLIIGCALLGGLIVGFYGIYRQYRLQREIKLLKAELAQAPVTGTPLTTSSVDNDPLKPMYTDNDTTATSFSNRK